MSENVFLLPGEYHVTRTPCEIATLLGSCVSVCLTHRKESFAAMNHFLLPEGEEGVEQIGRFGNLSTNCLLWLMQKMAGDYRMIEARLYGGAAVVGHLGASVDIGQKNVAIARQILNREKIPIVEENVGGTIGRRIYFDTASRQVRVRMIRKTEEVQELIEKRADRATRATRVLIVDDSPLVRAIMNKAVSQTPDMEVCGEAGDAYEARDLILTQDPDVICLDIIMPKMDGLKFLRRLSEHFPKPVVVCSTIAKAGSDVALRAYELGAVDVVDKDSLQLYRGLDVVQKELIPKLRRAAARVVRKRIFDD